MSLRTIGIYSESVSPIRKAGKRWEPLLVWHCVKDIRHLDKWWVGLLTLLFIPHILRPPTSAFRGWRCMFSGLNSSPYRKTQGCNKSQNAQWC